MNLPTHWRLRHLRYRLLGTRCLGCDRPNVPPRPLCPSCAEHAAARSAKIGCEVETDYPFGIMVVGNGELQEADITLGGPDLIHEAVFN
jgi:hypothetical protein